jgi:uncharacterized protein
MIRKVDLGPPHAREVFAEPAPLGLLGLAIGCAALTPIAFGWSQTPAALSTAAMFCLLFGCGGQLLAGLMSFANKNLFGGTLFTAFAFNWAMNWWALDSLAAGVAPDHAVLLVVDSLSLLVFLVFTYGFGFFGGLLFAFLVDIDLLYLCKVIQGALGTAALAVPIAVLTVLLGLLALWLAFAALINPVSGRRVFPVPGPIFTAPRKSGFDWKLRYNIFEVLYQHFRVHAFTPMPVEELTDRLRLLGLPPPILPDLCYLAEYGALQLDTADVPQGAPRSVRLTAAGIDLYEQLVLKKYQFG